MLHWAYILIIVLLSLDLVRACILGKPMIAVVLVFCVLTLAFAPVCMLAAGVGNCLKKGGMKCLESGPEERLHWQQSELSRSRGEVAAPTRVYVPPDFVRRHRETPASAAVVQHVVDSSTVHVSLDLNTAAAVAQDVNNSGTVHVSLDLNTGAAVVQNGDGAHVLLDLDDFDDVPFEMDADEQMSDTEASKTGVYTESVQSMLGRILSLRSNGDEVVAELCSICFEPLKAGSNTVIPLSCEHSYHRHCIVQWLRRQSLNPTCPYCRAEVPLQV
mmetsp:Transcript_7419/g.22576  ORF Transcript_7419/g.22576 Transcript_7419/m.22576 type:complete len:273 (-) Transcript_7419:246-1064(-)